MLVIGTRQKSWSPSRTAGASCGTWKSMLTRHRTARVSLRLPLTLHQRQRGNRARPGDLAERELMRDRRGTRRPSVEVKAGHALALVPRLGAERLHRVAGGLKCQIGREHLGHVRSGTA